MGQKIDELLNAVYYKNNDNITELLKTATKDNLNYSDSYKYTPLHWAAYNNIPGAVKALLDKGADKAKKDESGYTALGLAKYYGHLSCIAEFLAHENNADVIKNEYGYLLYSAIVNEKFDMAIKIIKAGANLYPVQVSSSLSESERKEVASALHLAIIIDHKDLLQEMCRGNIKHNYSQNGKYKTPLQLAYQYNRSYLDVLLQAGETPDNKLLMQDAKDKKWSRVRLVIDNTREDLRDKTFYNELLAEAIIQNNPDEVAYLLKFDTLKNYIHGKLPYGFTHPIITACNKKHWQCVEKFIPHIKDENEYGSEFSYALLASCEANKKDLALQFIAKGVNVNNTSQIREDNKNYSPLHFSILHYNNSPGLFRALIKAGARINPTSYGITPLELAFKELHPEAIATLLQNGAYIDYRAARYAAENRHWECVNAFIDSVKSSDINTNQHAYLLFIAIDQGNNKQVKYLAKAGARLDIKLHSKTPIEYAAHKAKTDKQWWKSVAAIAKFPTDASDKAEYFKALIIAIQQENIEITMKLIAAKTPLNHSLKEKNIDSTTPDFFPLHVALMTKNEAMFTLLLKNTAEHELKNMYGEKALSLALTNGIDFAISPLLACGAMTQFKVVFEAARNKHWASAMTFVEYLHIQNRFPADLTEQLIFEAMKQDNIDATCYFRRLNREIMHREIINDIQQHQEQHQEQHNKLQQDKINKVSLEFNRQIDGIQNQVLNLGESQDLKLKTTSNNLNEKISKINNELKNLETSLNNSLEQLSSKLDNQVQTQQQGLEILENKVKDVEEGFTINTNKKLSDIQDKLQIINNKLDNQSQISSTHEEKLSQLSSNMENTSLNLNKEIKIWKAIWLN